MIKRLLKVFGLVSLLLTVLLVGGLSWVLGTEKGLHQALSLANRFAPGALVWEQASGKVVGPLKVVGLHYMDPEGIEAHIGSLDFDWQPGALISLELGVDKLYLEDIEVRLAEPEEEVEPSPSPRGLPEISLPVTINLNDIVVNNVEIYPAGKEEPVLIDQVLLAMNAEGSDVHVATLSVTAPQGELHLSGEVSTRDDYPMDLTLSWLTDFDPSRPLQGEGTFAGSTSQLAIEHQVTGFAIADVSANVTNVVSSPSWEARIEARIPEPGSLSPLIQGTPQMMLQSSGKPDDYQAQITLAAQTTETGPVTVEADVSGSTEMLDINSFAARLNETDMELTASGQVTFATLQNDIKGQWKSLSWPLQGEPQFSSDAGRFDVLGTPENIRVNVTTDVDGVAIPEGQWIIFLEGSTTEISDIAVQGATLDGTVTLGGSANWENLPNWDVELSVDGINPGVQWREFPGSISLNVNSEGQISEDGPRFSADIKQLTGSLRNQPVSGGGVVQLAGEKLSIDNLKLGHGATRLDVNGVVDEQLSLDFDLSSPDLQTLLPELVGAISMAGSVSGSKEAPRLKASGIVQSAAYAENSVGSVNFTVDGGLGEEAESTLDLVGSDIAVGGQQISGINFSAKGSSHDHSVVLSAATNLGEFSTQLDGSYEGEIWNGSLASLQLEKTLVGDWRLREAVSIAASAVKADTSTLCLDNSAKLGSVCVTGNWLADGNSSGVLSISGLSPKLGSDYLPPEFILDTRLNGEASAELGSDGNLTVVANLALEKGKLTLSSDSSPVDIELEKTAIEASWRDNRASVDLVAAFADLGTVNVRGSISDPADIGTLKGSLDADFADLTLISAFVPQVQQVSGALNSNLSVSGTLQTPVIEGELSLRGFGAEIPETGMLIEDTQLIVNGSPDGTLRISGKSRSGDGQLEINGNFNPTTRLLDLNVEGDQYQVANTAMMRAVVSPALSIGMNESGMDVNGKVTIPSAYVNANGGNEGIKTVSSSSDVVYVSEEGEQAETPASSLNLDVQVVLGDSIEVEAGDFRGRLEGGLRIEQTPELAPRGTGTINVVNGDYVIYGQQLDMERGRILFSGGPVDNPTLDMQVARTVQEYDVVAGARIKGTAQSPRLELYSEPSMPDASILSYILLGQPPGVTGGSYTLGKYLTPELYVSYGIGLFDAINTFNMRYKLTDKFALEAASGSGSSTDLIYTIEK